MDSHDLKPPRSKSGSLRDNLFVRIVEPLLWLGLAFFVLARFGPQIEAWTGIVVGSEVERALPSEVAVTTLDGRSLESDELDDGVRVFVFWATWCRVCDFELPALERLHREWADDDRVQVIGLSIDQGEPDGILAHVDERALTFPQGFATTELRRALGAGRAVPTTVITDADGRIRHTLVGVSGPGTLRRAVRRLVDSGD